MNNSAVIIRGLSKSFKRYTSPSQRLLEWLPGVGQKHSLITVLNDLNFEIKKGQAVGIVGRNGAGKSTLLKLLTGTLLPSKGELQIFGRVAALLELGMGFHSELSGYENVLMAGQLQGMTRDEVLSRMAGIIEFAEIGDSISEPVRVYSSGMVVRLAFATATALKPDVLIVDEALSVGDAYFQHKCFKRIREFRTQGVTLIFVSHDPLAIKSLCDRAIIIEGGHIAMDADPAQVLDYYNALIAMSEDQVASHEDYISSPVEHSGTRSGTGEVCFERVWATCNGLETKQLTESETVELNVNLNIKEQVSNLTVGVLIRDRLGNEIFGTNTYYLGLNEQLNNQPAGARLNLKFLIKEFSLGEGAYNISVAAHGSDTHLSGNYDWWDQALMLQVGPVNRPYFTGSVRLPVSAVVADC
jgi:lipopolysaccharide transport system ATP-binding protein